MKSVFRSVCRPASYLTTLVSHSTATSLTSLTHALLFGGIVKACTYRTICIQASTRTLKSQQTYAGPPPPPPKPSTSSSSSPSFPSMTCVWAACPDPLMDPPPSCLEKHPDCSHACTQTYVLTYSHAHTCFSACMS